MSELVWIKSTRSAANGNCVQVAFTDKGVLVRDSKLADASRVLLFPTAEWDAFVAGVEAGEFDEVTA